MEAKPSLFVHADAGGTVVVEHSGKKAKDNRSHEPAVAEILKRLHDLCESRNIPLVVAVEITAGEMLTCGVLHDGAHARMKYLGKVMRDGAPWEVSATFEHEKK